MKTDWWSAESTDGRTVFEFRLTRDKRRDITGAVWVPAGPVKETLICFGHGASGNRYQPPIVDMASAFVERGFPVLSLDGPVHGLREVGGGGLQAFIPEFMRDDAVGDMAEEWHVAIDAAREHIGGGTQTIAYFGLSMGTLLGTQMLAERDDVAAAVLGLAGASEAQPHGPALLQAAAQIDAPILFLMQMQDEMIQSDHALALFDRFASSDKRLHAHPGQHAYIAREEIDFAVKFIVSRMDGPHTAPEIIEIADYDND